MLERLGGGIQLTLRTKFVVVLLAFCVAACVNIWGAVYYSDFQLAKATSAFEESPEIYKATTVVDLLFRALRDQQDILLETFEQGHVDADQGEQIAALASVVEHVTGRLQESEYLIVDTHDVAALRERLGSYVSFVREYLIERSGESPTADPGHLERRCRSEYGFFKTELLVVQSTLHKSHNREANLARDAAAMYFVLFGVVLAEIAALMVTFYFFRTWMLKPIAAIRLATEEIASGNLEYRLEESETDELGALAREVNHMAGSLAVAQKQLKQKERVAATGEMVSVVAHNIRNPVAGIRATAQTCMHDFESGSETYRQLKRIIEAVDSLEQWLKELVHLNRAIDLNIEPTDVDELVTDLRQIFQPASQRKNVSIDYSPCRPRQLIAVDRRYFVQAVASILDNAIEAAPPGSRVEIRTGPADSQRDGFFLEISDSGSGIPEALRGQIFDPYFSTKKGGTGIGLSMAKKIVEAHAGRLSVVQGNGRTTATLGATFRIEIS